MGKIVYYTIIQYPDFITDNVMVETYEIAYLAGQPIYSRAEIERLFHEWMEYTAQDIEGFDPLRFETWMCQVQGIPCGRLRAEEIHVRP